VAWICAVRLWALILPVSTQMLGASASRLLSNSKIQISPTKKQTQNQQASLFAFKLSPVVSEPPPLGHGGDPGDVRLNIHPYQIAFLALWMVLVPSVFESVSAEECLTTQQQLLEKR
jgi:hypothetical protein